MIKIDDQAYLKEKQYKTPDNLDARVQLHQRFNTNPYPWHRWAFDLLKPDEGMQVLEVGCGPGYLWRDNLDRLPVSGRITLADYSIGMVDSARRFLNSTSIYNYVNLDVQGLPFIDQKFDRIVANHMLYHVPDLSLAVGELYRVLRPGGRLCAATNGQAHMIELNELVLRHQPPGVNLEWYRPSALRRFSLENALEIIGEQFEMAELHIYECNLEVTDPDAIMAYIGSILVMDMVGEHRPAMLQGIRAELTEHFAQQPVFRVTKSQGAVVGIRV